MYHHLRDRYRCDYPVSRAATNKILAHHGARQAPCNVMEAHHGTLEVHHCAIVAHHGATEAQHGFLEAHDGAQEAHDGTLEAYDGAPVHCWVSTFLHNCMADSPKSGLVPNFFWTKKIPACIISLGYFQSYLAWFNDYTKRNLYTSCLMRCSTKGKLRSQELCTLNIVRIESSNRLSVPALSLLILTSFYSIWECSNSVLNNFFKNAIIFRRYFVICQLSPDQRSKGRGYDPGMSITQNFVIESRECFLLKLLYASDSDFRFLIVPIDRACWGHTTLNFSNFWKLSWNF